MTTVNKVLRLVRSPTEGRFFSLGLALALISPSWTKALEGLVPARNGRVGDTCLKLKARR